MGETVASVAGRNVDVRGALVEPDEGDLIDRLETLAGPFVVDCLGFGESAIWSVEVGGGILEP